MNFRNPTTLSDEEVIDEIRQLREGIDLSARRIHELSKALYHRARRAPSDQSSSSYVMYSNVWTRFAGMVEQGLRRSVSMDRLLSRAPEEERKPLVDKTRKRSIASIIQGPPTDNDIEELYGEFVKNNG